MKLTVDGQTLDLVVMEDLLEVFERDNRDYQATHQTYTLAAIALNSDSPARRKDPCPVSADSDGGSSRDQ